MNSRQIMLAMVVILAIVLIAYAYLHSRKAAPLQDPSPQANTTGALVIERVASA